MAISQTTKIKKKNVSEEFVISGEGWISMRGAARLTWVSVCWAAVGSLLLQREGEVGSGVRERVTEEEGPTPEMKGEKWRE